MAKPRKPSPRRILASLSELDQHELYEYLRTNSYDRGCRWLLHEKGIAIAPSTLGLWWAWYAARELTRRLMDNTANLATQLKNAGVKVTKENLDDWALEFFQRQAAIGMDSELCLRFYTERKKLQLQERALKLQEEKFERLKRMEEESRKSLQNGGTEAELIAKWKQILNFEE